jgi:hypothetical protein
MIGDSPSRNAVVAASILLGGFRYVLGRFTVFGVLVPLAFGVGVYFQVRWALRNRE